MERGISVSIAEATAYTNARRGIKVRLEGAHYRAYKWAPHIEVVLTVESVRQTPIRLEEADLILYYDQSELGPLTRLPSPRLLSEPEDAIQLRLRRDLYPELVKVLDTASAVSAEVQIRGTLTFSIPGFDRPLEHPVDFQERLRK